MVCSLLFCFFALETSWPDLMWLMWKLARRMCTIWWLVNDSLIYENWVIVLPWTSWLILPGLHFVKTCCSIFMRPLQNSHRWHYYLPLFSKSVMPLYICVVFHNVNILLLCFLFEVTTFVMLNSLLCVVQWLCHQNFTKLYQKLKVLFWHLAGHKISSVTVWSALLLPTIWAVYVEYYVNIWPCNAQ